MHKLTSDLARRFHTIGIENLNVRGMPRNRRLARSIADAGVFGFRRQPEYMAERRGGLVIVADRWFPSSKTCSAYFLWRSRMAWVAVGILGILQGEFLYFPWMQNLFDTVAPSPGPWAVSLLARAILFSGRRGKMPVFRSQEEKSPGRPGRNMRRCDTRAVPQVLKRFPYLREADPHTKGTGTSWRDDGPEYGNLSTASARGPSSLIPAVRES